MRKLWVGHEQVSLKPMHKVEVQTVTLTFDLVISFVFATHSFVMMITCATLFSNLTMTDEVIGGTLFWNTQTKTHTRTG